MHTIAYPFQSWLSKWNTRPGPHTSCPQHAGTQHAAHRPERAADIQHGTRPHRHSTRVYNTATYHFTNCLSLLARGGRVHEHHPSRVCVNTTIQPFFLHMMMRHPSRAHVKAATQPWLRDPAVRFPYDYAMNHIKKNITVLYCCTVLFHSAVLSVCDVLYCAVL